MTTILEPAVTEAPVVIDGLSAEAYHADRNSVSSTGLRKILNPGCPAQFKYDRDHPQPHKKEFDLGHAAHLLVLGEGPELEVIDAPDWKKVATRELRDLAYAEDKVPLLTKDHDMVQAMAEAIRRHPLAGPLFQPGTGKAEQSIFWTDPATGVRCRVRPDWLKQLPGLTLCVDYKGLALDTTIPTLSGWTTMGDLKVGDLIFDSSGQPCNVTHKSAVHERRCYRIRFDDGSSVICDDEHLWVTTAGVGAKKHTAVRSTEEIKSTLKHNGSNHHRVPVAGTLHLPPVELPIHPYVLGCWIGDGNADGGRISKPDNELFDRIAACGYEIGASSPSRKCPTRTVYGLRTQLRHAGLLGHKMIPAAYLRAGNDQRLELLRGLMDTDGSWNATRHQAVFTTTDKALAEAVRELSLSLGQRAIVHTSTQKGFGVTVEAYQVTFTPVGGMNPFALSRKADKVQVPNDLFSKRRVIVAVEEVPAVPTQCIAVDSPDRTYLCTEAMVPTHNTTRDASPDGVSKAIRDHGYHQQDAFYLDGIWAALQPEDARFIFVFQSKIAPYLITVRELADQDRDIGRAKNERALRIYADCTTTGNWPDWTGPVTDIPTISMPTWAVLNETEEYMS